MTTMIDTPLGPVAEDELYMLPSEAARYLGVSNATVTNMSDAGKLPVKITIGGYRVYRYQDIQKFAETYKKPRRGGYHPRHITG